MPKPKIGVGQLKIAVKSNFWPNFMDFKVVFQWFLWVLCVQTVDEVTTWTGCHHPTPKSMYRRPGLFPPKKIFFVVLLTSLLFVVGVTAYQELVICRTSNRN